MPRLVRLDTGDEIGNVNDSQLAFLVEQLEEEPDDDHNHFITKETLELFSDNGCDLELMTMLEKAMGQDEEMNIAWE